MKKYSIKIGKKVFKFTIIQALLLLFIIYIIVKFVYKKVLLLGTSEYYDLPVKCTLSMEDKIRISNDAETIYDAFNGIGVNKTIIRKVMLDPFYNGFEDIHICRMNYLYNQYGSRKLKIFGIPFTDKLSLHFLVEKYKIFKTSIEVEVK